MRTNPLFRILWSIFSKQDSLHAFCRSPVGPGNSSRIFKKKSQNFLQKFLPKICKERNRAESGGIGGIGRIAVKFAHAMITEQFWRNRPESRNRFRFGPPGPRQQSPLRTPAPCVAWGSAQSPLRGMGGSKTPLCVAWGLQKAPCVTREMPKAPCVAWKLQKPLA